MKPKTRFENFLAKIAGDKEAKDIAPRTRVEHYLNEIAENGTVPSVSEDDEGKFLRVVDGAWAATSVDEWQGGSY